MKSHFQSLETEFLGEKIEREGRMEAESQVSSIKPLGRSDDIEWIKEKAIGFEGKWDIFCDLKQSNIAHTVSFDFLD